MMGPSAAVIAAAAILMLGVRVSVALRPVRSRSDVRTRPSRRLSHLRRSRSRGPTDVDVANWCDDMARGLRSGSSLTTAFTDSGHDHLAMASVVAPVIAQVARGRSLVDALRAATTETSAGGLALTVVRTCAELGGPAAGPLERVAATLRARDALRQEQHAHSAQAQMSARVMTLIPVGMLALLASTDPRVRESVGTPAGVATVTLGATLNLVGWWWMQRIIGRPR